MAFVPRNPSYDIPDPKEMTLGERIKWARRDSRYTQRQLAADVGVSTGTIQQYELGKRRPSVDMLKEIAHILEIPFDWIAGAEDSKRNVVISSQEAELLSAFDSLNDSGKKAAVDRVKELAEIPKYLRGDVKDIAFDAEWMITHDNNGQLPEPENKD